MDNIDWGNELHQSLIMSSTNNPLYFNNNYNPSAGGGWDVAVSAGSAANTASFESLDCLANTTATSAELDDRISLIFSDCENPWNFAKLMKTVSTSVSRNSEEITEDHRGSSADANKRRKREAPIESTNLDFRPKFSDHGGGFRRKPKKARLENPVPVPIPSSSNINFQSSGDETDAEAIAQMKELIYRTAALRPVSFVEEAAERPRRRNVRVSSDPQTVAARQRRERISERIRALQKLVPGGGKMDTASMLDEAANYLKFLRSQVRALEASGKKSLIHPTVHNFPANSNFAFSPLLSYSFCVPPF